MSDPADLFPGFESRYFPTREGQVFARVGGKGPPLVLLHGFPQTHVIWHRMAPELAKTHQVIAMDLRGYGWSTAPRGGPPHEAYSKRAMAEDVLAVIDQLGHTRFALVGHDRGARVSYRLALDHPGRLTHLALLDIIPTLAMWERMDARRAMQVYHWSFLAQPEPMPETLIAKAPTEWLEHTLASWTAAKDLSAFDSRALRHYRAFFNDPSRIHACCEDYRAGATIDVDHDEASRQAGAQIDCPVLVLWGEVGIPAAGSSPLDAWKAFAPRATGAPVRAGHFLPEENPTDTLAALKVFLG
ncbi:alpha/beta hydrolase [Rhabdaerophilum sp. SD176]|jgi:haloacetate dehalogenase|uniref:alpha/beta fold hydrolase n=1 Tax=Rhabdaerophilum sp. SD176 TaxID=2983548 RepID=UPI0024E00546|nr:alpha/beta hydrolase [Rhabdaerophilum sp. SD176]